MKIIKEGLIKEKKFGDKTCPDCDCEFEYVLSDVEEDRDGKYVKCPTCKKFLAID